MVARYERGSKDDSEIKADVIVLGCSLPGIVTAHKLKKKFGNTMDIVVIDLGTSKKGFSKCNLVAFLDDDSKTLVHDDTPPELYEYFSRRYLFMYSKEFNITIPDAIWTPSQTPLNKLFEYRNGSIVNCTNSFHDFDYLCLLERFELNQYQKQIDESMKNLFRMSNYYTQMDSQQLHYYDKTTMENHICGSLLFANSREIMRNIVRLVCGVAPDAVSVLFYLHQCHRNNSCREYVDGNNTLFREKLLGYCRKRMTHQMELSIADITLRAKSIKGIRSHSQEEVILETMKGESNYVCRLLAMALRPDELREIDVESVLLSEKDSCIADSMTPGQVKKFTVQYDTDFWRVQGYSGEILSVRGPIVWAMERPTMSATGRDKRYSYLVGYLKATRCDGDKEDSRREVTEHLVKLFGESAAHQVSYKESNIEDQFVPKCGDYVALRHWTQDTYNNVEWAAMDLYRDGDVAAALEAGHKAYLKVTNALRPQSLSFDDIRLSEPRTNIRGNLASRFLAKMNFIHSFTLIAYTAALYVGIRLVRSYFKRN